MRIELAGSEGPIPTDALPDHGVDSDLPPQTLMLENGQPFLKHDYVGLGYTNFEVFCIGAVGGRGGDVEIYNRGEWLGGEGGGGGLHRAVGLLANLAEETSVVVGQAGGQGADGNALSPVRPQLDGAGYMIMPIVMVPDINFIAPQNGGDGGASIFGPDAEGRDICRASGGQGGRGARVDPMIASYFANGDLAGLITQRYGGNGGEGGVGGRAAAGGGAAGGYLTPGAAPTAWYHNASDGTWLDNIGAGGGGGLGGSTHMSLRDPTTFESHYLPPPVPEKNAGKGGKGSFSYADTSVYGPGQPSRLYDPGTSMPGTGGGARLNRTAGYGSRALNFNPNGAVLIRLTKVD